MNSVSNAGKKVSALQEIVRSELYIVMLKCYFHSKINFNLLT